MKACDVMQKCSCVCHDTFNSNRTVINNDKGLVMTGLTFHEKLCLKMDDDCMDS